MKNLNSIKSFFSNHKELIPILIVVLIAVVLSLITLHGDIVSISYLANRIYTHDTNLYAPVLGGDIPVTPPLVYLLDGIMFSLFRNLGIINNFSNNLDLSSFNQLSILALKLRFVPLFLIAFFLLKKIAEVYKEKKDKSFELPSLWVFSPIVLFPIFAQSNNDIYPVLFLLGFLYFAFKNNSTNAMVMLGLAAATKNFPLFLLIPFAIILANKDTKNIIKNLLVGGITYIIPILLFIKDAPQFLMSKGEGLFILQGTLFDVILIFPLIYILILGYLYFVEVIPEKQEDRNKLIARYGLMIVSLFFTTSFFLPQWLLWITPFLVLVVYDNRKLFWLYVAFNISYLALLLFNFGHNLDFALLRGLYPIVEILPSFAEVVGRKFSNIPINNIFITVFVALLSLIMFVDIKVQKLEEIKLPKFWQLILILPLIGYFVISFGYIAISGFVNKNINYVLNVTDYGHIRTEEFIIIDDKSIVYQQFRSKFDNLNGVKFLVKTNDKATTAKYIFILLDNNCKDEISRVDIDSNYLKDGAFYTAQVDSVKDSQDKVYCFSVQEKGEGDSIGLYKSLDNYYPHGSMILNNNQRKDDLIFYILHKP